MRGCESFEVELLDRSIYPERLHLLDQMTLAKEFRGLDRDDLATEYFSVVLRKPRK